jgi:Uma2 family endonuclease
MATQTQISPEEYLRMSFDGPDREYLDGEIVERNVGEPPHSKAQGQLIAYFYALGKKQTVYPYPELHLRLSPTRYRVADLAVYREELSGNIPSQPPFVVVEVVSRNDRYTEIVEKLEEYREWGVIHVWLVDPSLRRLYVYSQSGLNAVPAFEIPELEARIPSSEIF